MKTRYVGSISILLCSALEFACSGADVPKEITSSSRQEIASGAAVEAPAKKPEEHYANPRRMTPEEIANVLAVHPARVLPPVEVRRQNFENAFSALDNWQGENELDRQKLFLTAMAAAHKLPPAERIVAQAQMATFATSAPHFN